jgi:hypothetical protein
MRIKSTAPRDSEDGHSKSLAKSIFSAVLIAGAYILFNPACDAQQEQPVEQAQTQTVSQTATGSPKTAEQAAQSTTPAKPEEQPKKKKKKLGPGEFVVAPLPISSPAIGSGIVPVLGYIFPLSMKDKTSPPSVIGGAGLFTNNGSSGFAIGGDL